MLLTLPLTFCCHIMPIRLLSILYLCQCWHKPLWFSVRNSEHLFCHGVQTTEINALDLLGLWGGLRFINKLILAHVDMACSLPLAWLMLLSEGLMKSYNAVNIANAKGQWCQRLIHSSRQRWKQNVAASCSFSRGCPTGCDAMNTTSQPPSISYFLFVHLFCKRH